MTVKELKQALASYPENMDVFVAERKSDFAYGLVNSVRMEEITFVENPDFEKGDVQAKDTVVILDEE